MPVLVVEDDADSREMLCELLATEGYLVAGAVNGRDALEKMQGGLRPSVVLVDMGMPVMNGGELVATMKATPDLAHIPIVALTGTVSVPAGVVEVLMKPPTMDAVLSVAARYSRRRADSVRSIDAQR
jgi:CheY-like chemotaxis protein